MRFQWDPKKSRENIRKHGLDFADASEVFGLLLARPDTREEYGEERWVGIRKYPRASCGCCLRHD